MELFAAFGRLLRTIFPLICVVTLAPMSTRAEIRMCKKVILETVICVDNEDSIGLLRCDRDHVIHIHSAVMYKSSLSRDNGLCPQRPPKPDEMASQCALEDLTPDVRKSCSDPNRLCPPNPLESCVVKQALSNVDHSQCGGSYGSYPYIVVRYTCNRDFKENPKQMPSSLAIQMDSPVFFEGSKVHVDSYARWVEATPGGGARLNFRSHIPAGCCISLPRDTEMLAYPYVFYKQPQGGPGVCDQRVQITETKNGWFESFCSNNTDPLRIDCFDKDRAFFVEYFSNDNNIGSVFVLNAQVASDAKFNVTCGMQQAKCGIGLQVSSTPTTTTSTHPGPRTTTDTSPPPPPPPKDSPNWLAIVIGAALAALFLLILILGCILCRGTRRGQDQQIIYENEPAESTETYVTQMYLDGEQTSQLSLPKQDPNNYFYTTDYGYPGSVTPSYANVLPVQHSISGIN